MKDSRPLQEIQLLPQLPVVTYSQLWPGQDRGRAVVLRHGKMAVLVYESQMAGGKQHRVNRGLERIFSRLRSTLRR